MKVYISGPMVGKDYRNRFSMVEVALIRGGNVVANPARIATPHMTHDQYREATIDILDECDTILMLDGWQGIVECNMEMARAIQNKMIITFEGGKGCQSPSRPEPETSRRKHAKRFMKGITGAFSAKEGTTSRRK